MKHMRKVGLMIVTAVVSLGVLGISAPANALDTTWSCPTCLQAGHHH